MTVENTRILPRNDQDLRGMFQLFVTKNNHKFPVFIEIFSKAFQIGLSDQFGLGVETEDPTVAVFLVFSCGSVKPSQELFDNLMTELKFRTIDLLSIESTNSIYAYSYLLEQTISRIRLQRIFLILMEMVLPISQSTCVGQQRQLELQRLKKMKRRCIMRSPAILSIRKRKWKRIRCLGKFLE